MRSGTSIGANANEAVYGVSKAEKRCLPGCCRRGG
ncbi:MAG: hypothetical protein SPE19_09880 [Candidatus Faecousia sp.]|nr:hypothetical protein [Candidatus Faecousia sp.]